MAEEQKPAELTPAEKSLAKIQTSSLTLSTDFKRWQNDASRMEAALSVFTVIEDDETDDKVRLLLVRSSEFIKKTTEQRKKYTSQWDDFKQTAMEPEKKMGVNYDRGKKMRDDYANKKLKEKQEAEKKAIKEAGLKEERARLAAHFKTSIFAAIENRLVIFENAISDYFNGITLEEFEKKSQTMKAKPALKRDEWDAWFLVQFNSIKMTAAEFDEFIIEIKNEYQYDTYNSDYSKRAQEKLNAWTAKLPERKIYLEELAKKDADAAAAQRKADADAAAAEKAEREEKAATAIQSNNEVAESQKRDDTLSAQFEAQVALQTISGPTGVRMDKIATINCEPNQMHDVLSRLLYGLLSTPGFTIYKVDKDKNVLPNDEDGRPVYAEWLEVLLTQYAKKSVHNIPAILITEKAVTIQRK